MTGPEAIEILARDPELGAGIDADRRAAASAALRARLEEVPPGPWDPATRYPDPDGFGLLVLCGFLVRRVGRDRRFGAELLGPGDLLRPWQAVSPFASEPFESSWSASGAVELVVLDEAFAARAAPYPSVAVELVGRAMLRSRHLALALAIVGQTRVERRLHMLLWQLADRWGRIGPEGVRVEVPLTHATLAELVAARRPTVTTALGGLAEQGLVERDGGAWLLRGGPPAEATTVPWG